MSKSTFTITYDGPALQDGSMRIDDVAPTRYPSTTIHGSTTSDDAATTRGGA